MDDSNTSKEDKHKIDIKLGKQPKVKEQCNVDENPLDKPPIRLKWWLLKLISASNSPQIAS
jgi:hypothetical protein